MPYPFHLVLHPILACMRGCPYLACDAVPPLGSSPTAWWYVAQARLLFGPFRDRQIDVIASDPEGLLYLDQLLAGLRLGEGPFPMSAAHLEALRRVLGVYLDDPSVAGAVLALRLDRYRAYRRQLTDAT